MKDNTLKKILDSCGWNDGNKLLKMIFKYKKQTTFCYCPKCNNELCSSGSFIKDTDFVYYKCSECGLGTKWLFDAPAPILIK